MAETTEKPVRKPPEIGPYVVTWLLAGFGLWCLYDGFITTNPDMQEHIWFNRIMGVLLSGAAVFDYFRMRKRLARKLCKDKDRGRWMPPVAQPKDE